MTVKVLYIDVDGITKEEIVYRSSDYTLIAAPNKPVITGSGGTLHPSLLPSTPVGKSASLVLDRTAGEDILKGDLVRATTSEKVLIADPNTTSIQDATVLGIALNDALLDEPIEVLVLGIVTDASFSVFQVNAPLFLDLDGAITDERPLYPDKKFLCYVGKSLGGGDILIDINPPTTLGV
jgi:hypothetical protein